MSDILFVFDTPPRINARDLFHRWLNKAGLREADIDTVTLSGGYDELDKQTVESQRAWLVQYIAENPTTIISPAGSKSYVAVTGKKKITQGLGKVQPPALPGVVADVLTIVNPGMILRGNTKYEPMVYASLQEMSRVLFGTSQSDDCEYNLLVTNDEIRWYIRGLNLLAAEYDATDAAAFRISVDMESNMLSPFQPDSRLTVVSVSHRPNQAVCFFVDRSPEDVVINSSERQERLELIRTIVTTFRLAGANFKFDIKWFCRLIPGLSPFDFKVDHDTQLSGWNFYNDTMDHSLEAMSSAIVGFINHKGEMQREMAEIKKAHTAELKELKKAGSAAEWERKQREYDRNYEMVYVGDDVTARYACMDGDATTRVAYEMDIKLRDDDMFDAYHLLSNDAIPYVAQMEINGAWVNQDVIAEIDTEFSEELVALMGWFYTTGFRLEIPVLTATGELRSLTVDTNIGQAFEFYSVALNGKDDSLEYDEDKGGFPVPQVVGFFDNNPAGALRLHAAGDGRILLFTLFGLTPNPDKQFKTKTGLVSTKKEHVEWLTENLKSKLLAALVPSCPDEVAEFMDDPVKGYVEFRSYLETHPPQLGDDGQMIDFTASITDVLIDPVFHVTIYTGMFQYRRYKRVHKLLSSYITNMPQHIGIDDCVHATFGIRHTATGRYNCVEPPLQTIPFKSPIKHIFQSRFRGDGVILGGDYGQIELRVMAMLANDQKMIDLFLQGGDIHRRNAAIIFEKDIDLVTESERRKAKAVSFGIPYGIGPQKIANDNNMTLAQGEQLIEDFLTSFVDIAAWIDEQKETAKRDLVIRTLMGHRRWLPNAKSADGGLQGTDLRRAVNTPIQEIASDITALSFRYVMDEIRQRGMKTKIWNLVHDSIVSDCPIDEVWDVMEIKRCVMTEVVPGMFDWLTLPLTVDFELGYSYGHKLGATRVGGEVALVGKPEYYSEVAPILAAAKRRPEVVSKAINDDGDIEVKLIVN